MSFIVNNASNIVECQCKIVILEENGRYTGQSRQLDFIGIDIDISIWLVHNNVRKIVDIIGSTAWSIISNMGNYSSTA